MLLGKINHALKFNITNGKENRSLQNVYLWQLKWATSIIFVHSLNSQMFDHIEFNSDCEIQCVSIKNIL